MQPGLVLDFEKSITGPDFLLNSESEDMANEG